MDLCLERDRGREAHDRFRPSSVDDLTSLLNVFDRSWTVKFLFIFGRRFFLNRLHRCIPDPAVQSRREPRSLRRTIRSSLPRKNNVRSCGRSRCFTFGDDWIAGLWSLEKGEMIRSHFHWIWLTLHALSVWYFPPLPSTASTKSLKNLIFTFPSRICNLPMWEKVNSTLRWAATDRLKICKTCLTHCSIWSRVKFDWVWMKK